MRLPISRFLPALILTLLFSATAWSGTFTVFGPKTYVRGTGAPVTVTDNFTVPNLNTQFTLRVHNGGLTDSPTDFVSSTTITVNGVVIVAPNDLNQNIMEVDKPVTLLASNEIDVQVRGAPGGTLAVDIIGVDNAPPTITATANPAANAAGWNKSNVTVTFSCSDTLSGIAACSPAALVSTEGANQIISGTATDKAGNTATAQVTLNIDKTPPVITVASPANNSTVATSTLQLSGTVSDALSGVASISCNGIAAQLQAGAFSCSVSLVAGANNITVNATDVAGNTATSLLSITLANGGQPAITDFNPKSGPVGTLITLTGTNLTSGNTAQVTLNQQGGGTIAAPISSASPNSISFVIPAGAASGLVTVTASNNTATSAAALNVTAASSFTLTAGPATATLLQGKSATYSISLDSADGFTQLAKLSVSGLPSGVTATLSPSQIAAGQISILTVNAPANQTVGTSTLTISAAAVVDGISSTQTANVNLSVQPVTTSFFGRVVESDTVESPLPGIGIKFLGVDDAGNTTGCSGKTVADAAGNFIFTNLPDACTGRQLVWYIGTTALDKEVYAGVNLAYTIIKGQATGPELVHLPRIDNAETVMVKQNAPADQTFGFKTMPGVSVTVYAGTIFTLPNGQRPDPFPFTGVQVPVDRLPDAPVDGPGTLRAFIVAFQPDNTAANQPVAVSFPNFINTPPGVNMELDTLDPVVGDLVKYGTGTVSGDGTQVVPDPDPAHPGHRYGIEHFDWHGPMSPAPNGSNPGPNDDCTEGEDCEPSPDDGEPVDLSSGIQVIRQLDMRLGSERGEATVIRTYRTLSGNPGPFGVGSSHNYGYQLNTFNFIQGQSSITLIMPNGNQFLFVRQQNGTLINTNIPALKGAVMTSPSSGIYTLRWKNGTVYNFAAPSAGPRTAFLNSVADANGNTVTLVRGNSASPIQITQIVDPAGRALNLSYDNFDRITSILDPAGRIVSYTYNSQGTLSTVTDPAGGITRYTYNADGRLFQIVDPRNATIVQNSYDSAGHITQQVLADGGVAQFAYTLLNPNTQNSPILQTQVTDPLGNVTRYHFDPLGFLLDVTDPSGAQRVFTRDPQSNMPLAIAGGGTCAVCEDPEHGDQTFTYDENGNVLVRTDGSGAATTFTYDPVFNKITSITNPLHNTTRFSYDPRGNLLTITDANGKITTFGYNSFGLLTSITDPLLQKITYNYDSFGNLVTVTDPLGNKTQTSYDAISRPTQVVDASGRITSVSYDPLNRVSNHVDALGHSTRFTYDPIGNVLDVQNANGGHFKYSYDAAGRPLTLTFPNGKIETRSYDLNGNLVSFVDRRGQTSRYLYDPMNRLLEEDYQDGSKVTRSYDANGRLVHVVDSASGQFNMAYDEAGRMIRSSSPVGSVQYTYDASGQVLSRTVAGQPAIQYSYDPAGDLLSATGQSSSVHLTYDAKRRLASMSRSNSVASSYVYDPSGRLLTAKHGSANLQQYTYDSTGNRSTYSSDIAQPLVTPAADNQYDVNNQLVSSNASTYTYDNAGNLTSVTGPNGTTAYTWDSRNRMVAIAAPDGQKTALVYDFKGNLISQTQTGPNVNTSKSFVLDMLSNVAFISKSDGDQMLVLSGAAIDQHFAVEHSNGTVEYGLNDSLNSTTATVDGNGVITARFNYEPYGATTTQSTYPFQYTGRLPVANGLYYYRARYYDTATGRFLSEDPAGLNEGVNFYRYVYDNPINFIDPTGMTCTYSQSTGQMVCVDDSTGQTYYTGQGYAGTNSGGNNGRNNPNAQDQNDVGPLPRGDYQLTGDWHNSPNTGRNTMNLSPLPGNDCFQTGRDCNSFRIHGNNSRNDASHGCIVLPPDRTRIHRGETLHVVQ